MCVCSLGYPTCNAHASYYIPIVASLAVHVFSYYLINGTVFGKKLFIIDHKMWVLIFLANFV